MKNLSFIILTLWIIPASCQTTNKIKLDCIKIAPIGISDLPRDTIYIGLKKINSVTSTNSFKDDKLIKQIITNVKTLSEIALYIRLNNYNKNSEKKDFNEYGSFNISGYRKDSLIINYKLNKSDSKKYLNSLIDMLVNSNGDIQIIKVLKEHCLEPINY